MSTENEFDYYVVYPKNPVDKRIATVDENPEKYIQDNFWELHGKPVPDPRPTSFTYSKPVPRGKLTVGDYFWATGESVFSRRVAGILAPMNIGGVQLIPATVKSHKGEVYKDFYYLHIWRYIGAMDKEKSDFRYRYEMYHIESFVLDRGALAKIPLEERLIFKREEDGECLYHLSVVQAIMATDPVGVVFEHCETKKTYIHEKEATASTAESAVPTAPEPQSSAQEVQEFLRSMQQDAQGTDAARLMSSGKRYKAFENSVFNEILYRLTDESAMYILEKLKISQREAYETENVEPLHSFTKFFIEDKVQDPAFYCFATSDANRISFACMETGKEDTLLVFEVDVPAKRCTVIPSPGTYGFNGRACKIVYPVSRKSINELREYAGAYFDEDRNEIPFPGVNHVREASPEELLAQRYFPDMAMSTVDEMMDIIAYDQDEEDEICSFRDYYQDEYPDCVITTDGRKITLTFCHLDEDRKIEGEKDTCTIDPKGRKIILTTPDDKHTFKVSEQCIDRIRSLSSSWKGEHFGNPVPFPGDMKKKPAGVKQSGHQARADQKEKTSNVKKSGVKATDQSDIGEIITRVGETPSTNEMVTQNQGILITQWFNNRAIAGLLDACHNLAGLNDHERKVFNLFVSSIFQYPNVYMLSYDSIIRIDCYQQKGEKYKLQSLGISYGRDFGLSVNAGKSAFAKVEIPDPFKAYVKKLLSEFKSIQKTIKLN